VKSSRRLFPLRCFLRYVRRPPFFFGSASESLTPGCQTSSVPPTQEPFLQPEGLCEGSPGRILKHPLASLTSTNQVTSFMALNAVQTRDLHVPRTQSRSWSEGCVGVRERIASHTLSGASSVV
jgi:hypothetical protein